MRLVLVFLLLAVTVVAAYNKRTSRAKSPEASSTRVPLQVFKDDQRAECQELCVDPCQQVAGPSSPLWICSNVREEVEEKSIFKPKTLVERVILLTFVVMLLLVAVVFCGITLTTITCWTHFTVSRRPGLRNVYGYDAEKSIRL